MERNDGFRCSCLLFICSRFFLCSSRRLINAQMTRVDLSLIFEQLGRYEEAVAQLNQILAARAEYKVKESADLAAVLHIKATLLLRLKRYEDALQAVEKACQVEGYLVS